MINDKTSFLLGLSIIIFVFIVGLTFAYYLTKILLITGFFPVVLISFLCVCFVGLIFIPLINILL